MRNIKRIITSDIYALKNDARGKIRIRPDKNKPDQGATWAIISNYKFKAGCRCPKGVFIDITNWRGEKLICSINTQDTDLKCGEIHSYKFFEFKEFEQALEYLEKSYKEINGEIFGEVRK